MFFLVSHFGIICGDELSYFRIGEAWVDSPVVATIKKHESHIPTAQTKLQHSSSLFNKTFLSTAIFFPISNSVQFQITKKNIFTTEVSKAESEIKSKVLNKHCHSMSCWGYVRYNWRSNFDLFCVKCMNDVCRIYWVFNKEWLFARRGNEGGAKFADDAKGFNLDAFCATLNPVKSFHLKFFSGLPSLLGVKRFLFGE